MFRLHNCDDWLLSKQRRRRRIQKQTRREKENIFSKHTSFSKLYNDELSCNWKKKMMMRLELLIVLVLLVVFDVAYLQSTCPVVQQSAGGLNGSSEQKCKCGIKVDGHIYIYCARKQLARLPKFTRSSILYDELILSGNRIETIQVRLVYLSQKCTRLGNIEMII